MIENNKIKDGITIAKNHSEYFLKQSEKLHNEQEFQAAIPFAILSFEESSKVDHLLDYIKEKRDISENEWKELRDHKFKLTQNEKEIKTNLENESDLAFKVQSLLMQNIGLRAIPTKDSAIELKEKEIETQAKFSKIKEICFYANWNIHKNNWDNFDKIPKSEKEALSFFMIWTSKRKQLLSKLGVEFYLENPFTKPPPDTFSMEKLSEYIVEKTNHSRNLQTTQKMQEFDKEYGDEKSIGILQLGYQTLCKYFSN